MLNRSASLAMSTSVIKRHSPSILYIYKLDKNCRLIHSLLPFSISGPTAGLSAPTASLSVPTACLSVPAPGLSVHTPGLFVPTPGLSVPIQGLSAPTPGLTVPTRDLPLPTPICHTFKIFWPAYEYLVLIASARKAQTFSHTQSKEVVVVQT